MVLFEKLKSLFVLEDRRKTKVLKHVSYDQDPTATWETVKELGDGAFGKVYMVCIVWLFVMVSIINLATCNWFYYYLVDCCLSEMNSLYEVMHPFYEMP